jgi:hypothetical protein
LGGPQVRMRGSPPPTDRSASSQMWLVGSRLLPWPLPLCSSWPAAHPAVLQSAQGSAPLVSAVWLPPAAACWCTAAIRLPCLLLPASTRRRQAAQQPHGGPPPPLQQQPLTSTSAAAPDLHRTRALSQERPGVPAERHAWGWARSCACCLNQPWPAAAGTRLTRLLLGSRCPVMQPLLLPAAPHQLHWWEGSSRA